MRRKKDVRGTQRRVWDWISEKSVNPARPHHPRKTSESYSFWQKQNKPGNKSNRRTVSVCVTNKLKRWEQLA